MARPSVSEHLKVLLDAELVTETRHRRHRIYAVTPEPLRELPAWLSPYEQSKLTGLRQFLHDEDQ